MSSRREKELFLHITNTNLFMCAFDFFTSSFFWLFLFPTNLFSLPPLELLISLLLLDYFSLFTNMLEHTFFFKKKKKTFLDLDTPQTSILFSQSWMKGPLPDPPLCLSLLAIWLLPLSFHWDSTDPKVTNDFLRAKFNGIFSLSLLNLSVVLSSVDYAFLFHYYLFSNYLMPTTGPQ